jgi:hypothetical protein
MAQTLLEACSRAASPTTCVTPSQADEEQAFAVAIVVWLDNGDSVRVQVGLRQGKRKGEWLTRRVDFDASDDEGERWTATGFVVGTLAGRFFESDKRDPETPEQSPVQIDPAPTLPERSVQAPRATPAPERRLSELSINLGALVRPQFTSGPWGLGGLLESAYQPESWPVFVHGGVRASYRARDRFGISSYFGGVAAGLGAPVARLSESWQLRAAWAVGLQRMSVRVSRPSLRLEDQAGRWLAGTRVAFEVDWMPWRSLGGFASVGAVWWWGSTDIELEDEVVQDQPTLLGEVALGLRFPAL